MPTIDETQYAPATPVTDPKLRPLVLRLLRWGSWAFLMPLVPFLLLFAVMLAADETMPGVRWFSVVLWPIAGYLTLSGLAYAGVLIWYAVMPYGTPKHRIIAGVAAACLLALGMPLVVVGIMNLLG